jgi:hypothetical protein
MLRRLILRLVVPLSLLCAIACEMSSAVDTHDLARLVRAEAKWRDRPFADYTYEVRVSCFCPPEIAQWNRVTVRGQVVTAVNPIDTDPPFPLSTLSYWRPIDSLFVEIFRSMSAPSSESYLAAIIVKYDDALGFPTKIEYRAKSNVADGGATHELRNVRAIQ